MMILNCKKPFGSHGLLKNISALCVNQSVNIKINLFSFQAEKLSTILKAASVSVEPFWPSK